MTPKCDICGQFFSYSDPSARITMLTPDSAYTSETYESLCGRCARKEDVELAVAHERERCAKVCEEMGEEAFAESRRHSAGSPFSLDWSIRAVAYRDAADRLRKG